MNPRQVKCCKCNANARRASHRTAHSHPVAGPVGDEPGREERLARYTERAERGLPLFTKED